MKAALSAALAFLLMLSLTSCGSDSSDPTSLLSSEADLSVSADSSFKEEAIPEKSLSDTPELSSGQTSEQASVSAETEPGSSAAVSSQTQNSTSPAASSSVVSSSAPASSETLSEKESSSNTGKKSSVSSSDEVRAVWISYLELYNMLCGKTKSQFRSSIGTAFDNATELGLNTVFVHVRSHSDAFYDSDLFPWSVYCTGTEGKDPGFDPLEIMVEEAHDRGLSIEAWINPYRIKGTADTSKICKSSPAYDWLDTDKVVILSGSGIYYNPADEDVIDLIVEGVEEIVQNYDVDGIHFDDYFYPTTDKSFDEDYYDDYLDDGGTMSLSAWRRDNVNRMIKRVYKAIKSINSGCQFGISPAGNMDNNYNTLYCDVYTWVENKGYVDYICPQIYFGFEHGSAPYLEVLETFDEMISVSSVRLISGLAAYKIGVKDTYAGDGAKEWIQNSDILARQVDAARDASHYGGFALYTYSSLFTPSSDVESGVEEECGNLEDILS
ncbi:MAG TPA: family 10 glycosylhydrolase [Oscillospiraceae bacterium]|nr:family 10 glycosylhydrolase [Oscillospiraceae bacterium]